MRLGASPAGSRWEGRSAAGLGGAGRAWWLWRWLGEEWVELLGGGGGANQTPTERRYAPPVLNSRRLAQSLE
jgi:3-mercaptopyruvate sulfurtransferase SseA